MALHVLGHVEAQQLDAHGERELARHFGLCPPRWGPENRKAPMGLSGLPSPERAILMAAVSAPMASSWPNTTVLRSRSSVASLLRSSLDTDCGGMRAILETMCSISPCR